MSHAVTVISAISTLSVSHTGVSCLHTTLLHMEYGILLPLCFVELYFYQVFMVLNVGATYLRFVVCRL